MGRTTVYFCDHCLENQENQHSTKNVTLEAMSYNREILVAIGDLCKTCEQQLASVVAEWKGNDLK